MRGFTKIGALLAIMLLMASCIRVEGTITVEDDGSGTVDFLTALNTESLTGVLGDFDIPEDELGDTDELCDGFESELGATDGLPSGAVVTPYDEDGFCGTRVQYSFAASDDPSAQVADILDDDSARLYKEGDNWFFETAFNTDDITSGSEDVPPAMFDALFADASFRITVDLPGRAVAGENNATEVGDDGRFTWDIDILNPPATLFAQTEPGSGGGTGGGGISPLLIGLIVLALAAAVGFFLWKRNNDAGAEPSMSGLTQPGVDGPTQPFAPAPGTPGAPGAMATMPVDGPPIVATPPVGSAVVPDAEGVKETVVMNAADIQQSIQDAATETAAGNPQPEFDEALNAWVVNDPTRGRLRHDPATDTWNPI